MKSFAPDDLIILVSLAGDQDQITFARLRDRVVNGFAAIGDLLVWLAGLLNSLFSVTEYLVRIFRARIVGSQNHDIAQANRPLRPSARVCCVAIAATAKHRDDSSFRNIARSAQNIQQRIVAECA